MFTTRLINNNEVPYDLLYLADEDDDQIAKYKDSSVFYGTFDDEKIIGIIGVNEIDKDSTEIVCVAVAEEYQNRKIGTGLVETAISVSKEKNYKEIVIKTGNCGIGQLYLYQRCGFRFDSINKDYMIKHYPNPIYENDIQCFDQIVLKYRIYSQEEQDTIIKEYWSRFIQKNPEYREAEYEAWSFGLTETLANRLLAYVRMGKKTGTSSALELYEEGEKVPEAGDLSIITHGNGLPGCIIRTEEIITKKFKDVTDEMARLEGEGDLSLKYWREVHEKFFRIEYRESGKEFSEEIPVIYEIFKVIFDEDRTR
ncbi:MAG: GNAT family N-acetyltransferase [Spirochaetales bacterium]|nr:GNAT family N-acetyltransferase [Spirochaetales bacterium]